MSLKWTGSNSESGILRKGEAKEKREELFVFGYSCKLFREDDKALHIDQGKHLIPWMGDESLKIDRYDARGALQDLSQLEAPPGGFDWRVELTRNELEVEQLCDEERYRALHTDEDEEEMYKEEELKRLHAAGYGQVSFNYDNSVPPPTSQTVEIDEPFVPSESFKTLLPPEVVLPESVKLNAIIEKTAKFIASQGAQMEILIKAKQRDNPQFQFLNKDSCLNPYYAILINLIKAGQWPEKKAVTVEEKPPENDEYLHPSLASTIIESAPSIPSIHYKPSADCDYTMLISKMRGEPILDEAYVPVLAPGEVPPPGTEPLPPRANAEISRAPVMYKMGQAPEYTMAPPGILVPYQQYAYPSPILPPPSTPAPAAPLAPAPAPVLAPPPPQKGTSLKSTGLSLMKHYNTDSDSDVSDFDDASSTESKDKPLIVIPPDDVQVVIDKMAGYVARNGADFENIVRAKNDARFTFLEPDNIYYLYYKKLMLQKRGEYGKLDDDKLKPTVSFSIKKMKEPEAILPKPALPYESSSDDETGTKNKHTDENIDLPKTNIPQIVSINKDIPPVVVYKLQGTQNNDLPIVKAMETAPRENTNIIKPIINNIIKPLTNNLIPPVIPNVIEKKETPIEKPEIKHKEEKRYKSPTPEKRERDKAKNDSEYKKEKKRHKERKKDREHDRSKSEKEYRKERSENVDRRRDRESSKKERDNDRHKKKHREEENEIITLEENSDELIDLTGDLSDSKGGAGERSADGARQLARRQRAAAFLRRAGVQPGPLPAGPLPAGSLPAGSLPAGALPAGSLASAMVDTLETIRKKKEQEREKRRRHEKRRHKEKRGFDEGYDRSHRKSTRRKYSDDESDFDSSKKKKRKKDKRPSKSKKKRASSNDLFEEEEMPVTIDIVSTLKELRNNSPTKELVGDLEESSFTKESTDSERGASVSPKRKSRKEREYSEGEWSSDSGGDSESSKND